MDLPEIALVGAGAADLLTTELALAHDGFRELNPVMGSPAARVGVKTLATVAVVAGSRVDEAEAGPFAREKEALYRELYKGRVEPAAGLVRFLEALKAEGITTAVATAAPRVNLDFVLDEAGLGPFFDVLVDIGSVSRGRPAPDLYLKAADGLRRKPGDCVAFEDSYPGVRSALAAGMRVVAVTTTHTARNSPTPIWPSGISKA